MRVRKKAESTDRLGTRATLWHNEKTKTPWKNLREEEGGLPGRGEDDQVHWVSKQGARNIHLLTDPSRKPCPSPR